MADKTLLICGCLVILAVLFFIGTGLLLMHKGTSDNFPAPGSFQKNDENMKAPGQGCPRFGSRESAESQQDPGLDRQVPVIQGKTDCKSSPQNNGCPGTPGADEFRPQPGSEMDRPGSMNTGGTGVRSGPGNNGCPGIRNAGNISSQPGVGMGCPCCMNPGNPCIRSVSHGKFCPGFDQKGYGRSGFLGQSGQEKPCSLTGEP